MSKFKVMIIRASLPGAYAPSIGSLSPEMIGCHVRLQGCMNDPENSAVPRVHAALLGLLSRRSLQLLLLTVLIFVGFEYSDKKHDYYF